MLILGYMRYFSRVMVLLLFISPCLRAAIEIDQSDNSFYINVKDEIKKMKTGARGLACKALVEQMEAASANILIRPLTRDENTWHPNDKKGKRSHVVAMDTKIRDAAREKPTNATIFLSDDQVNPKLSLFRVGGFVRYFALGMDLARGQFSDSYILRQKRSVFFQNAWRDSMGFELLDNSSRIPTDEYQKAKAAGLIIEEFSEFFPIMDINGFSLD